MTKKVTRAFSYYIRQHKKLYVRAELGYNFDIKNLSMFFLLTSLTFNSWKNYLPVFSQNAVRLTTALSASNLLATAGFRETEKYYFDTRNIRSYCRYQRTSWLCDKHTWFSSHAQLVHGLMNFFCTVYPHWLVVRSIIWFVNMWSNKYL